MIHKRILAIDPGPGKSGYVYLLGHEVFGFGHKENSTVASLCAGCVPDIICIEGISYYGKSTGATVSETSRAIGKFEGYGRDKPVYIVYQSRGKNANKNGIPCIREFVAGLPGSGDKRKRLDEFYRLLDLAGRNTGCYAEIKNRHVKSAVLVGLTFQKSAEYKKECGP